MYPFAARSHGSIGQADVGHFFETASDFNLNVDRLGVKPANGLAMSFGKHKGFSLRCVVNGFEAMIVNQRGKRNRRLILCNPLRSYLPMQS